MTLCNLSRHLTRKDRQMQGGMARMGGIASGGAMQVGKKVSLMAQCENMMLRHG
jgi:hypothetical protein